jgi:membrane-bound serine protease (ClpP class)
MVHIGRRLCVVGASVAAVIACVAAIAPPVAAQSRQEAVTVIQLKGVIDPPLAQYLEDRLEGAARDDAHAVILEIDTPGGLQVSNQRLVSAVIDSPVPIVAWVAPRSAQAASTGALLVYASHLAYMAESTDLGPAGPATLSSNGASEKAALSELFTRLSQMRGRGPGSPAPPVLQEQIVPADIAVQGAYVDGSASSLRELLETIDGQQVALSPVESRTLETWDEDAGTPSVTIRFAQMNLLQRLLHSVISPEIAFLLLLLALFGLIFELYNPGIGLAAIAGAVALVLSIYSLSVLPTNWGGVLIIVAGILLLLFDLQTGALGLPSIAGLGALVGGALMLFRDAPDALALSPWAIVAGVTLTLLFFVSVMTAALRVRLRRPVSDEEGIVGTIGEAKTDIAPEGTVLTKGTLWRARTMETGIAAGSKVEVKATEGLVLLVEPLHEEPPN